MNNEEKMQELLRKIGWDLRNYLTKRERELREQLRGGIKLNEGWNGYEIIIEGNIIKAQHDSSTHRWNFYLKEAWGGQREIYDILSTSEKKGQAIIDFFKALIETQKSSDTWPFRDENSLVTAEEDPAANNDEIIAGAAADPESSDEEIIEEERII